MQNRGKMKQDDLEGKAADLDVDITPLGDDTYAVSINLRIAIPVLIGIVILCGSVIFFIWS